MKNKLWCDLKTDKERIKFLRSGRAWETGIIARSITEDVAHAFERPNGIDIAATNCSRKFTEEEVLSIVDTLFHELDSSNRTAAREFAIETMHRQALDCYHYDGCDNGGCEGCDRECPDYEPDGQPG